MTLKSLVIHHNKNNYDKKDDVSVRNLAGIKNNKQNSQENICARAGLRPATLLKRDSGTGVFL